jgi:hypothetical protein
VALSCLATLWQEVSSRAIYVSDAVGCVLGRWRRQLVPYSVHPVVTLEACNEDSVLRETSAR